MAAPVIQFKRGLLANLPGLRAGEPGFTTDSKDLYVGIDSTTGNNQFVGSGRFWSVNSTTVGSGVNLVEGTDNGTNFITLKSPDSLSGIVTFVMPSADGNANDVLKTDGSGNLSFAAPAASTFDIAADSGTTDEVSTGSTITFAGTTNEIETTVTNNQIQIGLPNDVTIGGGLNITGIATFASDVKITSTGFLQIAKGTTGQRPGSPVLGQIRYNTSLSQFEGYGAGNAWGSLGGVKDVDGDTFIRAETTAGDDNDSLEFLTGDSVRVLIDSSGNVGVGTTVATGAANASNTTILNAGIVTANNYYGQGGTLTLGTPSDSSLTDGALNTLTSSSSLVNSIDDLNELGLNIIKDTAVTDVDFTANTTSGAATLAVTLTITSSGNANRFDINWGDGSTDLNSTDSTPSHNYTDTDGGTYDVTVTAKNSSGVGAGSSQSITKENFITVFTPAPVMGFSLFRAGSGGSALTGNDLYVVDNTGGTNSYHTLHLDNTTTNATGVGATFTVNWGDGSSVDTITGDNDDGGAGGSAGRLSHQWADGTASGTSQDTLTLTITNHTTTDPDEIPKSTTTSLKVYQDDIANPDGLSSKTLPAVSSSVGTSPKLTADADDRSGGGTGLSAGDDVVRLTSGNAVAGPITTFAYNADSGDLSAIVNGSADGARTLTSGDDSGTYTSLIIDSESDYQLLNSGGSTVTFANSVYYPGNWKGFKARVTKAVSGISVGINSMRLSHSATGDTNSVAFVCDKDHTATPTTHVASATLTQNTAGTFRYISGIPYYNTGSPDLTLAGVTIDDLTGQTYSNVSNVVEVDDGTNQESTSSDAITSSDYTYANIDGSTTFLSGGVPKKNIGVTTGYAIGSLTVPITSSSVRTVSRVKVRARNVNGAGSYSSDIATNVQVHTAAQSNISEVGIAVADSLGSFYDDDGLRIFDFATETTDNPSFNGSTNFYTANPYTESADPGISTTREATVRIGNIKHDTTDYSSGYLPVGPDLSSNRSGDQYFTFAFRRRTTANFTISITSAGIGGLWIAAPGTQIDSSSGINGWLRADQAYAGSGIPGSDTGNSGNGSNGCAATSGDVIEADTALSGTYDMTLGEENLSNATGNVALIRIALSSGQSVTALSIS